MLEPFVPHHFIVLVLACLSAGCTVTGDEDVADAERYAQRETRLIDEQSFEQARERSRSQVPREQPLDKNAPPALPIDLTRDDGWQFGMLDHPLEGRSVCAAVSGVGTPVPQTSEAAIRLIVLADSTFATSDVLHSLDVQHLTLLVDAGLPMKLDVMSPGTLARVDLPQELLLTRLRYGDVLILRVEAADGSMSTPDQPEIVVPFERIVELGALPPMLDELARCAVQGFS